MVACTPCREAHVRCLRTAQEDEKRCKRCIKRNTQCIVTKSSTKRAPKHAKEHVSPATLSTRLNHLKSGSEAIITERFHLNKITKILISWDQGTAQTKVNYSVFREAENQNPRALQDTLIGLKAEDITWVGGDPFCPTQLALPTGARDCSKLHWGSGVDHALASGQAIHDNVFKYLKPQLYDDTKASAFHCDGLLKKIHESDALWRTSGGRLHDTTLNHGNSKKRRTADLLLNRGLERSTPMNEKSILEMLWRRYQENAFLYVMNKIWKRHQTNLPWQPPKDLYHEYQSLDEINFGDCQVETVIAIPASASVQQIDFALRTSREAGMSNCFAVSEPCSAAALVLQTRFEKGETLDDLHAFLFVDIGSGTCDVTTFKIDVRSIPGTAGLIGERKVMSLKEIVKGQTAWVGMGIINQAFLRYLEATFDIDEIVRELNVSGIKSRETWTRTGFVNEVEAAFEIAKKRFSSDHVDNNEQTLLKVPALQRLSYYVSKDRGVEVDNGHIRLSPKTMKALFAPCVSGIISLICGQLQEVYLQDRTQKGISIGSHCFVTEIYLVGGGAENRYLTDQIRAAVGQLGMGHKVVVVQPQSYIDSLLMTCRGGIVLAADKDFIGERVLRRAYGFSQDIRAYGSRYEDGRIFESPVTDTRLKKDIARFLVKIGDRIRGRKVFGPINGERWLYTYCNERNEEGWEIAEVLWYTDNPKIMNHTDLWVDDERHQIHEAGKVIFRLKITDVMNVQPEQDLNGDEYRCVEYRSWFELEGYSLEFFIEIPRTGLSTHVMIMILYVSKVRSTARAASNCLSQQTLHMGLTVWKAVPKNERDEHNSMLRMSNKIASDWIKQAKNQLWMTSDFLYNYPTRGSAPFGSCILNIKT